MTVHYAYIMCRDIYTNPYLHRYTTCNHKPSHRFVFTNLYTQYTDMNTHTCIKLCTVMHNYQQYSIPVYIDSYMHIYIYILIYIYSYIYMCIYVHTQYSIHIHSVLSYSMLYCIIV